MCIRVVQNPVRMELETDCERVRFWAQVPENYPQCVPGSEIQAMRIEYFPDTDSLYIDLADRAGVDAREIDIDIDQASKHHDLRTLDLRRIPFGVEKLAG